MTSTSAAHAATATAKREINRKLDAYGIRGRAISANARLVRVAITDADQAAKAARVLGGTIAGTSGTNGRIVEVAR